MSALPETWLVHLIRMADEDPEMTLVRLAKEEEGVGISAGAHLAGVKSAMLMQNHGFLASINGSVSCAQGGVTEDVLRALRIPFSALDRPEQVAPRIAKAQTLALSANKPVALLDQLPPTGAVVMAAPLKIVHGSGSPLRVLAIVPV